MRRKLTITIDEEIYKGLHKFIGKRKISRFIEEATRPYITEKLYEKGYAEMANDKDREKEALEWSEAFIEDINR